MLFNLIFLAVSTLGAQPLHTDSIFEPKLSGRLFTMRSGIIGSQFYRDDWEPADIRLLTGDTVRNKLLKYDVLLDEVIWWYKDSMREVELEKGSVDEFWFRNGKSDAIHFRKIRARLPGMADSTEVFVQVLIEKAAALYVFRKVRAEGSVNRVEKGVLCSFDLIVPDPLYMICFPDGKSIYLRKTRKRLLLKALPEEYAANVKQIIQKNHLSVHSEKDLTALAGMIN